MLNLSGFFLANKRLLETFLTTVSFSMIFITFTDKRAEAESGDIDNIFEKRHGKEEGEIESDISSSADISPERTVQIASEGMFSEKTHVQYPEDSDDDLRGQRDTPLESQRNREVSKDNDHSSGSSYSDYDDDDNDAEVSRDAPDDSMLGNQLGFIGLINLRIAR